MTEVLVVAQEIGHLPWQARDGDAGWDLRSVGEHELEPGSRSLVPVGLRVAIPAGYTGLVLPRSGLALEFGVTVLNAPGCIDPGYRGELGVLLINLGSHRYVVRDGDRIAQLVICPVARPVWLKVSELPSSDRAEGGFGSSGQD